MELKDLAKRYFDLFSKKDINNLRILFSKDIVLKDWEIEANGIIEVEEVNKKNLQFCEDNSCHSNKYLSR